MCSALGDCCVFVLVTVSCHSCALCPRGSSFTCNSTSRSLVVSSSLHIDALCQHSRPALREQTRAAAVVRRRVNSRSANAGTEHVPNHVPGRPPSLAGDECKRDKVLHTSERLRVRQPGWLQCFRRLFFLPKVLNLIGSLPARIVDPNPGFVEPGLLAAACRGGRRISSISGMRALETR